MAAVEGAMFLRALRLGAGGTAAALLGRVAGDLLEEWPAAVGHAVADGAEVAGLADRGPPRPVDGFGQNAEPSQPPRRRLRRRTAEGSKSIGAAARSHD